MSRTVRVGLLTQWYDPEPGPAALPAVLARGLAARGHDVQVLTGFPNYPTGVVAPGYRLRRRSDEVLDGVQVRRVALYPSHGTSAVRRLANYASFGASALVSGTSVLRGLDAVWVNYSPITIALPMFAARYLHGVPQVSHVLDLWPDTLLASGFAARGGAYRWAESGLDAWCRAMYRASTAVAYISPSVGAALEGRGVPREKLHYVPMWADEAVFRPAAADRRSHYGIGDDDVVLLYAGSLGEAQGLETLIDACAQVVDTRLVCLVAGSGVAEARLRARASTAGARNVRFIGRVPQEAMTALMATADLTYLSLRPDPLSAMTMPSKLQAAMASGRPVLAAADGDVAAVVRESGAGLTADPRDSDEVARQVRRACDLGRPALHAMGTLGRAYYERQFSAAHGVELIEALLRQAAGGRRA